MAYKLPKLKSFNSCFWFCKELVVLPHFVKNFFFAPILVVYYPHQSIETKLYPPKR